jgi:hypothetical protein
MADRHPGKIVGQFAGRQWYAEVEPKRIDWGGEEHGLNIQQMQFARAIRHSVAAEFKGGGATYVDLDGHTVEPEALARFEYALVTALHAYDTARTERLNFLEGEYRKQIDITPSFSLWPRPPEEAPACVAMGDPIGDRVPIFPPTSMYVDREREPEEASVVVRIDEHGISVRTGEGTAAAEPLDYSGV